MKKYHEIRDPIHVFIKITPEEREIVNSCPFQRLRYIHQLAMTSLIYPGATHKRFEHSLGVMELATRVFDVITAEESLSESVKTLIPQVKERETLKYWKQVIRVAALCHDLGHLPFSHASEDLLPNGWSHEVLTMEIIRSDYIAQLIEQVFPEMNIEHIVKLALKQEDHKLELSNWEAVLAEIIVGNSFGVDRMDYLLRDSYYTGVAYGVFDHYRLVDTLRILTAPPVNSESEKLEEPQLGVQEGGLKSAEALQLARYFMFSQIYYHPVRLIYDLHLRDFLQAWLPENKFPIEVEKHLSYTDSEVISAIRSCSINSDNPLSEMAKIITDRRHFKVLYCRNPIDQEINKKAVEVVREKVIEKFGPENVRCTILKPKDASIDFPVELRDGRIASSLSISEVLNQVPQAIGGFVFIKRDLLTEAKQWLDENREEILQTKEG